MQHDDEQAVDEENPSRETSSVGQELKAAREALNLPIKQLAGDLRIEPHYLTALEENDFGAFSASVFAKGYLKQYAIRLGLDEKELLSGYYRQVGTQELPMLLTPTLESQADQQQARWLVAGSAVVLVVAVISIWRFSTPEPEVPVVRQPAASIAATETIESEEEAVVAQPIPLEPLEEPVGPTLQVELNFNEDSWTEVIDARGERLFYGLGSAGARTRFTAMPPLSFFLGNADGVELLVDEMPYVIPEESRQGNLARFVILESAD
jgi:cytoskeleton protein RodZ